MGALTRSLRRLHVPAAAPARSRRGIWLALTSLTPFVLFAMIPAAIAGELLGLAIARHSLGLDFRQAFWPAGRAVLDGRTPYPPLDADVLARGASFVYPPIVAIAVAPLALLPVSVATAIAVVATALALAGTMWALDVRDWRCYGAAFASAPVLDCVQTASASAFFALAIAVAWRWRSHGLRTPLLIGAVIATKLFLWPLLLWLAVVRGIRSALLTGIGVSAVVVGPWLLGFPGFTDYPRLLSLLVDVEGRHAYSPRALALSLGAGPQLAQALALAAGGCLLALAALELYRGGGSGLRALALTLLASLLLSPLVWSHYFVVLLPVIAIARPRLAWPWFVFFAFWAGGAAPVAPAEALQIALGLAVIVAAALPGLVPPRSTGVDVTGLLATGYASPPSMPPRARRARYSASS